MNTKKHICCSTDNNYIQHCAAMLCSLLENNSSEYCIHILCSQNKLNSQGRDSLAQLVSRYNSICIFHDIDEKPLEGVKFRINRPLSYAAYYRILLASILDESIETILYLDCDIIVLQDVAPIFSLNLDGYALAAVQDMTNPCDLQRMQLSIPYEECFFCSGVMLINLKYWREHNSEAKLLEYSKKERFVFLHDQDALNAVFYRNWFRLPPKWNKFNMVYIPADKFLTESDYREYCKDPVLIHYVVKPWHNLKFVRYTKQYLLYLQKSGIQTSPQPYKGSKLQIYQLIILSDIRIFLNNHNCRYIADFLFWILAVITTLKSLVLYPFKK